MLESITVITLLLSALDRVSNSHFGGALAGLGFGRRVREAAQHENEQRVPTVEA